MTAEGARYVSKGKWIKLTTLDVSTISFEIGENAIGTDGFKYILEANWPFLKKICAGICFLRIDSNGIDQDGLNRADHCKYKTISSISLGTQVT